MGIFSRDQKANLKDQLIKFSKISVGATENSIIAACLATGTTSSQKLRN